jgi:hypothetical protein
VGGDHSADAVLDGAPLGIVVIGDGSGGVGLGGAPGEGVVSVGDLAGGGAR